MPDEKISAMTVAAALTGAEVSPLVQGGANVKASQSAIAASPAIGPAITTGAGPTDLDPTQRLYIATTGGTAGVEILNIPNFPLDGNGVNVENIGHLLSVYLTTRTNPSDSIQITCNGARAETFQLSLSVELPSTSSDVILDFAGAVSTFIWIGDRWVNYPALADFSDDTLYLGTGFTVSLPSIPSGATFGGAISLGAASTAGSGDGGNAAINAGNSATSNGASVLAAGGQGAGVGGSLTLTAGAKGTGSTDGQIILQIGSGGELPTADPHIKGALFAPATPGPISISGG